MKHSDSPKDILQEIEELKAQLNTLDTSIAKLDESK